jgi:AraC-like DNA-binding protein/ligand-binding sensor protein
MNSNNHQTVLDRLSHSQLYQDYERAFTETTGMPLSLMPMDGRILAHHGRDHENRFCALLAQQNETCAACLQTQRELTNAAPSDARTVECFAGLWETAVPLRAGEHMIGYLRTGQVLSRRPTPAGFNRIVAQFRKLGVPLHEAELREAWFATRVAGRKQYESVVKMLNIFSAHLSIAAGQIMLHGETTEPVSIIKAREFINAHHAEDLTLPAVAQAVHMSVFYFCKQFKKSTGMSFTEYLGRVRVENAKEELLKPHVRISEVAYRAGFQSLTHFNRVFKKLHGESPSTYRNHLPATCAA